LRNFSWPVADQALCIGCGVCTLRCKAGAMKLHKLKQRVLHPETDFEQIILQCLERGTLQNQLFDNLASVTDAFARACLGGFLRLSPVKRALMSDALRSRFLGALEHAAASRGKGRLAEIRAAPTAAKVTRRTSTSCAGFGMAYPSIGKRWPGQWRHKEPCSAGEPKVIAAIPGGGVSHLAFRPASIARQCRGMRATRSTRSPSGAPLRLSSADGHAADDGGLDSAQSGRRAGASRGGRALRPDYGRTAGVSTDRPAARCIRNSSSAVTRHCPLRRARRAPL
jgi:ferredoxin